jgi:tRNA-specific adenosine deaminase 3
VKRLSVELPLTAKADGAHDLSRLKRVKRIVLPDPVPSAAEDDFGKTDNAKKIHGKKRRRSDGNKNPSLLLRVLLGPVAEVERSVLESSSRAPEAPDGSALAEAEIERRFEVRDVQRASVPARPANSRQEWLEFQRAWPSAFYPHQTAEFRERSLQLSAQEIDRMQRGMEEALLDASRLESLMRPMHTCPVGTVVVDPATGSTVARSSEEHALQTNGLRPDEATNPLQTSILLAIQAVSRIERRSIRESRVGPELGGGQYLCTGYDVYTTLEPAVFEAMALVHARIRRLVFGCCRSVDGASCDDGARGPDRRRGRRDAGGIAEVSVHSLPGTNHKYRAFACREGSDLWKASRSLMIDGSADDLESGE